MITSTPLPPVAALTSSGHSGRVRVDCEIAAEFGKPRAPLRIGRGTHHQRRAHQLGDLHAHQADARTGALHQQGVAALERAGGDDRVVHGAERNRKARGLLIAHVVGRDAMDAQKIRHRIFRDTARRRRHHPVARRETGHLRAHRLDFAGTFEPDSGTCAADRAMAVTGCHDEIGPVEGRGADADQHLVRFRGRLLHVPNLDPGIAQNRGLHLKSFSVVPHRCP